MDGVEGVDQVSGWMIYLIVGLFNAAGHWFPWRVWQGLTNERGQLNRVLAYVYGAGSIIAGVILRCVMWILLGQMQVDVERVIVTLLGTVVAAAAGTLIPYGIDEWVEHRALVKDAEDYDQTLRS